NIDREELVDAFNDSVLAGENEWPARNGAVTHSNHPFWFRHLVVERLYRRRHFLVNRPGDDHDVCLTGRRAEDLGSESSQVEPGSTRGHHLDGAAGQAE